MGNGETLTGIRPGSAAQSRNALTPLAESEMTAGAPPRIQSLPIII